MTKRNINTIDYLYQIRKINTDEYKSIKEIKDFHNMDIFCLINIYHQAGKIFSKEQFVNDVESRCIAIVDNNVLLRSGDIVHIAKVQPELDFFTD